MRRTNLIVAVLLSGVTACSGSDAQLPYEGFVAVKAQTIAPAPTAQPPIAEPVASEANVPWSIALLSDVPDRPVRRTGKAKGKVTIVQAEPEAAVEPAAMTHDADIQLALEPEHLDERPAEEKPAAKSCSGVVNRRS